MAGLKAAKTTTRSFPNHNQKFASILHLYKDTYRFFLKSNLGYPSVTAVLLFITSPRYTAGFSLPSGLVHRIQFFKPYFAICIALRTNQ
ncbi:hypothetical protein CA265_10570 [Sphingobacteriaceae bacterium GW460-11-11-14-LB5]|nr:hypothetical protein CA265_10570 [Sphingobacteriaceae bacterium GW460-11-11-14-LB5]